MARSTAPSGTQIEPEQFLACLTAVEAFADLRVDDEDLDRLGHDPSLDERLSTVLNLWNTTAQTVLPVRGDSSWHQLPAEILTILICGGEAVLKGVRHCLPEPSPFPVSADQRLALYLVLLDQRLTDCKTDSAPWIKLAAIVRTLCAPAMHETAARCRRHVGVGYGLAGYLWKQPDAEEELGELLKGLAWRSINRLAAADRKIFRERKRREDLHAGLFPELSSALVRELQEARLVDHPDAKSGARRVSDPVAGLVKALDGYLNILPLAVAQRMRKDEKPLRRKHRYRTVDVAASKTARPTTPLTRQPETDEAEHADLSEAESFDHADLIEAEGLEEAGPNAFEALLESEDRSTWDHRAIRMMTEAQRLRAESGRHRVGYEALIEQRPLDELAKKNRKSRQTIATWRDDFLFTLRKRLSIRSRTRAIRLP